MTDMAVGPSGHGSFGGQLSNPPCQVEVTATRLPAFQLGFDRA